MKKTQKELKIIEQMLSTTYDLWWNLNYMENNLFTNINKLKKEKLRDRKIPLELMCVKYTIEEACQNTQELLSWLKKENGE